MSKSTQMTIEEMKDIIRNYGRSGQTIETFCRENFLSVQKMYHIMKIVSESKEAK